MEGRNNRKNFAANHGTQGSAPNCPKIADRVPNGTALAIEHARPKLDPGDQMRRVQDAWVQDKMPRGQACVAVQCSSSVASRCA